MSNRFFMITGTSSGIGQAVARSLLESGDLVCGISRRDSEELNRYPQYSQILLDLQRVEEVEDVINRALTEVNPQSLEMICLINNAAMLEPLLPIDECTAEDILSNIHICLIAPMILTSIFIKATQHWTARRKIINISSGSGSYAHPSMSVYSAAKAGLNRFTQSVGAEQTGNDTNPVEIISVDPGMVETEMQQTARSKREEEFRMAGYFKEAYLKGRLQSTDEMAGHLMRIIENHYEPGRLVHYCDL
ncbi:SDR family NAD(P)-dependent oxidoreductase [Paenibacillus sp. J2TS4]|uniref:SDR family NAD(P)-dependent oxidoreductase n=1 Tax=Paenibacillus sp. J2TS4 TaxID=2807194 RepID=UPI001B2667DD|nr:SDR family NAD(P)-dependent oxidoreductase [Paenibacillus sp. J2TS4]GIP31662.1 short-chain dehydrogenase [Paenibacillus sp. J2TS4]